MTLPTPYPPSQFFFDRPIQFPHLMFVNEFEAEIPANFTLDACPRGAFVRNGWKSYITDARFPHSSVVRGRKYVVEVYCLQHSQYFHSLIKFADECKRVLPGAWGGAVLASRYGAQLPKDRWIVCLDKSQHVWLSAFGPRVPPFFRRVVGWRFYGDIWINVWAESYYVVLFRELVLNL